MLRNISLKVGHIKTPSRIRKTLISILKEEILLLVIKWKAHKLESTDQKHKKKKSLKPKTKNKIKE